MKVFLGAWLAQLYNRGIGRVPSRFIRLKFLQIWLGEIGEGTGVQSCCRFLNGRKIYLGKRNVVNYGCVFDGRKFVIRVGDDVSIGPEASILTLGHDPQSPDFEDRGGDVIIGDRVWIGFRAIILPGLRIGEGAVVGAGSVVTKNVLPYTIVAGNPACIIGQRSKNITYKLQHNPFLG